jgi:phospholipid transport system substrate-binding protein
MKQQRTRFTGGLILAAMLFMLGSGLARAQNPEDAVKLVSNTTAEIKTAIKKERKELETNHKRLMQLVDKIVLPHFDFHKMSSWALGKYWRTATDKQKKEFTTEFQMLLVRTYAVALLDNVDRNIKMLPLQNSSTKADRVVVRTEVPQEGGFPIPINYKMYYTNGQWKVYDVEIDGISLVSNYRTSFSTEIRKSGIDSVIASMKKRNESGVD